MGYRWEDSAFTNITPTFTYDADQQNKIAVVIFQPTLTHLLFINVLTCISLILISVYFYYNFKTI